MIDCTLQVTSDGVLICMSSINLLDTTNVQTTSFSSFASAIPNINQGRTGVFTFNLTWDNISDSGLTREFLFFCQFCFIENVDGKKNTNSCGPLPALFLQLRCLAR
jgi:hypothetical protein